MSNLLKTPLHQLSSDLNAKFTEFSGYQMPLQYSSITIEHQAVRNQVGMFDISHMGKFELKGKNILDKIQKLVPSDLSRLKPGSAQYTVLLNPQGGIIDDVIFYYQQPDQWILIVNAATTEKDLNWLILHLSPDYIIDHSRDQILIALQGPIAINHLQDLVTEDLTLVAKFGHFNTTINNQAVFIARTGYTGEDGFEIMSDPATGNYIWQKLIDAGVTPCGLGCRDTLRLEASLALYGQDIDDTTTPIEARLSWLIHWDKASDFIGRSVLEQQKANGVERQLVGLEMTGRNIARHDYPIWFKDQVVGAIASGTWSITLQKAIALAYLPTSLSKIGTSLEVEIRGKKVSAIVVKRPFYKPSGII